MIQIGEIRHRATKNAVNTYIFIFFLLFFVPCARYRI
nr:MAG TPA: hypothetical protein [Bacteriophage sp.]